MAGRCLQPGIEVSFRAIIVFAREKAEILKGVCSCVKFFFKNRRSRQVFKKKSSKTGRSPQKQGSRVTVLLV